MTQHVHLLLRFLIFDHQKLWFSAPRAFSSLKCDISKRSKTKVHIWIAARPQLDRRLTWGRLLSTRIRDRKKEKTGGGGIRGLGHLLSLVCLPRPSPRGSSSSTSLGHASDSAAITDEDTWLCLNRCCPCSCCAVFSRLLSLLTSLIPRVGFAGGCSSTPCRCDSNRNKTKTLTDNNLMRWMAADSFFRDSWLFAGWKHKNNFWGTQLKIKDQSR